MYRLVADFEIATQKYYLVIEGKQKPTRSSQIVVLVQPRAAGIEKLRMISPGPSRGVIISQKEPRSPDRLGC